MTDFAAVRRALEHVAASPATWRRVCLPVFDDPPLAAAALPAEIVAGLVEGGVVSVDGGLLRRRRWVTRQFGRPYYLSLHDFGRERGFVQDIWPETHALLERLRAAPPGTFAEVGTGCGVLAVEAALAGHRVVATDIDAGALETTAWNARLHGATLDLRRGHLAEPLGDARFDLVLSAIHYGGPSDMLRVELLHHIVDHLEPGGAFVLATFLDWDRAGVGLVEAFLRPLGRRVRVTPIRTTLKPRWFTIPTPLAPGLVARGRVLVEIGAPGGAVEVTLPDDQPEAFVPLARLTGARAERAAVRAGLDERTSGAWDRRPAATVGTAEDVAALEALMADVARGEVELDTPIPFGLHDACRWGAQPCLKAYRALVDTGGGVRPCSHGDAIGTIAESAAAIAGTMAGLHAELEARRGCATCAARTVCSQCAFPAVVDEATYCELIRRHAAALPVLHRVLRLIGDQHPGVRERLRLRWGVARSGDDTAPLPDLRSRLGAAFLYEADGEHGVELPGVDEAFPLTAATVPLIEEVMAGGRPDAARHGFGEGAVEALLRFLAQWLA